MKTLVVDDDVFALRLLERQLRHAGHDDVEVQQDASAALRLLEQAPTSIDLVICDLHMPGVDGVEFLRHLTGTGYRGGVVLASGQDARVLESVRSLALAHGIHVLGAFVKPIDPAQLAQVLSRASSSRAAPVAARPPLAVADLREALDNGALVNHYQPKVAMADGAVVGVEALVRLRHPLLGLVYPDRFVGVAEAHGCSDALTHAVITSALRDAVAWSDAGRPLQVAINLSMDNLLALDFPDTLDVWIAAAGVTPADLVLEVTESRLMHDPLAVLDVLNRLRLKGFRLAIDDFGTGHSSLAQLRDIPFQELKLDRGFVHRADCDPARMAIVESTLAMAHRLNMTVVAEGIEDVQDWDYLAGLGCDVAQGWHIARAMSAHEVVPWCAGWDARRRPRQANT
jgi:EAL domain-containing protein (putative c-di-GMP-specific phosphodiesterase class I)/AmiR/NasT family two-component response regulator